MGRDREGRERSARRDPRALNAPPDVARGDEDIYADQHILIVGVNGCGKSTLASFIGGRFSRVLAIDTKGGDPVAELPNATLAIGHAAAAAAIRAGGARIVYRPTRDEMLIGRDGRRRAAWLFDELLAMHWARGGQVRVIVHEIADVADQDWCAPQLDQVIREGRFRDMAVIACSQLPNRIPVTLRSECKHVFVFTLIDDMHRRVVAGYAGSGARELVPMDRSFLHRGPRMTLHRHPPLVG